MASNETVLKWRVELQGADGVKEGLRKINELVKDNKMTQTEANRAIQLATKDTRNFRAEQNLLNRSFQQAHPQLATLSRAMSTFGSVARAGLNIANSLNTMWIRQNTTLKSTSDEAYAYAKATREVSDAYKSGDPQKIADALENQAIALNHLNEAQKTNNPDFWTKLFDIGTVGLNIASAVSMIFTNLMKNTTIATAITNAGGLFGGIFSVAFKLAAYPIAAIADWLIPGLTGKTAMHKMGLAGSRMGSIFGLAFITATATAGALAAYYLIPEIEKSFSEYNKKKAAETGQEVNAPGSQFVTKDVYIKSKIETVKPVVDFFQSLSDLFTKGLPGAYGEMPSSISKISNVGGLNISDSISLKKTSGKYTTSSNELTKTVSGSVEFKDLGAKITENTDNIIIGNSILDEYNKYKNADLKLGEKMRDMLQIQGEITSISSSTTNVLKNSNVELIKSVNSLGSVFSGATKGYSGGSSSFAGMEGSDVINILHGGRPSGGYVGSNGKTYSSQSVAKANGAANGFEGMVNRPTLFLAGEAGPENVSIVPLKKQEGGGGINVIVNVQGSILTERELFRRVDENLKNELRKRNFRILQ